MNSLEDSIIRFFNKIWTYVSIIHYNIHNYFLVNLYESYNIDLRLLTLK